MKMMAQSPGRRLSHLAKRRAIFSSANLQSQSSTLSQPSTSTSQSRVIERQILIDPKVTTGKIRTPKRRTPSGKGRRRTPTSASKRIKENILVDIVKSAGPSRETSKRALFQSPPKARITRIPSFTPEVASRVQKSKRVLFSPAKLGRCSSFTFNNDARLTGQNENKLRHHSLHCISELDSSAGSTSSQAYKRKISEVDLDSSTENLAIQNSLKFAKSQSFCVAGGSGASGRTLMRTTSEIISSTSGRQQHLSENHKKKLLWAVSQALQNKQITFKHSSFKHYVSVLARVTKRLYMEYEEGKPGGTSEKMLK